jgi:hypothetical protein
MDTYKQIRLPFTQNNTTPHNKTKRNTEQHTTEGRGRGAKEGQCKGGGAGSSKKTCAVSTIWSRAGGQKENFQKEYDLSIKGGVRALRSHYICYIRQILDLAAPTYAGQIFKN